MSDDEPMTELYDADVDRVDLVGKAANGTRFLIMKQAGVKHPPSGYNMLPADYVRELIKAGDPVDTREDTITMTGTPAAIAEVIHKAAVAQADDIEKATISTADQNNKPDSDFAYIEPGGKKVDGKTEPRSKRHFYIGDASHVRNALARASQSPFGSKAMPKIRAAAKKFKVDVAKAITEIGDETIRDLTDRLYKATIDDLAVPLPDADQINTEIDDQTPGDPDDPESPAWESVDAARAGEAITLAVALRRMVCQAQEREQQEASVGGDGQDAGNAMDLGDVLCAIDCILDILAPFAVNEQAESDERTASLEQLGKGMVRKAGKVLSAQNEQAIRDAAASLERVLATLPASQPASDVTKSGEPDMTDQPEAAETVTKSESLVAPAAAGGETTTTHKITITPPVEGATEVAKAKGDPQVAVYDANGKLVGTADQADINPIAAPEAPAGGDEQGGDDTEPATAAAPADQAQVPGTETIAAPAPSVDTVGKSTSDDPVAKLAAAVADAISKAAGDNESLAEIVKGLQETVTEMGKLPDDRKSPIVNGATGTPGQITRGAADEQHAELRKAVEDANSPVAKRAAEQALAYALIKDRFAN